MGGHQSNDEDVISGINVIPLVDIVLVVLIIFMLTATFITTPSIEVDLPQAASGDSAPVSELALVLDKDGTLYLNGKPADEDGVRAFIQTELAGEKEVQAVIAADKAVPHGSVIGIIDLVRTEGVAKFAINVEP